MVTIEWTPRFSLTVNLSVPASKVTDKFERKAQKGRHMVNTKRKKYRTMIVEDDPMAARIWK